MIRVVDGLRYDTDAAALLHTWNHKEGYSLGVHWEVVDCCDYFYRTANGRYFLFQPYMHTDNVIPLDKNEAMNWLSEHSGGHVLNKDFLGDMVDA